MKSLLFYISLLLLLTLSSCTDRITRNIIISLPSEVKEGQTILQTPAGQREKVYVIDGNNCSIYERGIDRCVLEIQPLSDTSHSISLIPYGSEPGEMLLVDCSASGSKILIRDIVQKTYTVVDVTKVMEDSSHRIESLPMTLLTQEMVPFNNDKILYLNQGSFRSKEPRFYIIGTEEQGHKLSKNGERSLNVLDGTLLYNQENNRIAFVHLYSPVIELYIAQNKRLLCTASISRSEEAEVVYVSNDSINQYLFANKVIICFMTATSDNERIVAAYRDEQDNSRILLFDWDGNLLGGFIVEGEVWSVSLYNDYLYCWERGKEQDMLVQYKLDIL